MLTGEVDIGLRPATLNRASQEFVVDCWFYNLLLILLMKMFMNTREVDILVMDLRRLILFVMMVMGG